MVRSEGVFERANDLDFDEFGPRWTWGVTSWSHGGAKI